MVRRNGQCLPYIREVSVPNEQSEQETGKTVKMVDCERREETRQSSTYALYTSPAPQYRG